MPLPYPTRRDGRRKTLGSGQPRREEKTGPDSRRPGQKQIGIEHFEAHDIGLTCANLCSKAGGDLEQIKFLLGHSSIQTTKRYLGCEQEIAVVVNDEIGL